ncbi:hypothetical protein ACIBSS_32005 [Micromonospora aurantiaca]|uniref:hypothetical protein n=1 Tax=Micromonospora aurantiaca (nom. illeg.) TaxID=47850 RepID=UPI000827AFBD|nr:hypothetical protein [Micromonospora aurantiaca]SCL43697.1 hypothetical protein GA0070615_6738 [Micromonospora aurantiaca]SCL43724.1 hypothetical protein GA0070615_6765 [Micromonospora aurantiaca]
MQTETTAPAPEAETAEMPAPDLSVLAAEQPPAEQGKDDKATPQELAETTPASVGLVVALVVISVVAAVVVAMWMVSPLMALLLGAGLIVVAVLAGAGWLAWRKFTRRDKTARDRFGRDRAGRTDRTGGRSTNGGKSPTGRSKTGDKSGWWPFGRNKTPGGGGKTPGGSKTPGGGGRPTGDGAGRKKTGDKSGGGWWPFGRNKTPGGGGKTPAGGKAPAGGKPTGDGAKKARDRSGGGWWPFGRNKTSGGGGKTPAGGGKAPTSGKTPGGGGKPAGDGGSKPTNNTAGRKAKTVGGAALLGLRGLARAVKKTKTADTKTTDGKAAGADEPAKAKAGHTRPTPGGHRPETVIDVDLDDISSPTAGKPGSGSSSAGPAGPGSARRTGPLFDPGSTAGSERWDRTAPTPLRTTAHHLHQAPVSNHLGGPEMSTTTSTVDQDAMRVANRYASLIEKAETLTERARACRDAADQYRRDARDNQESAENHKMAARTIRDANVAHEHAVAARDAEAEAAREILAARFYEAQAEEYEAQARSIGF